MDESLYTAFAAIEEKHWWFVARRRIILDQVEHVIRLPQGASILDAGCGTGGMLRALQEKYRVSGMDMSETAVRLCRASGLANVRQGTFESDPFPGELFDAVLLLDVIEHIEDDVAALRAARERLKPGGLVLLTVPAYQVLWSTYDELNHHKRRYVRRLLETRLEGAGLQAKAISYYNTSLFPLALVQRVTSRVGGHRTDETLELPAPWLNGMLTSIFATERFLLRRLSLPYGLSLIAVARPRLDR